MITPEQHDKFLAIDEFLAQNKISTISFMRGTDTEATMVTINGLVERKTDKPLAPGYRYMWLTRKGEPRFTLRGEVIKSDGRTESRADGKVRENLSKSTHEEAKKRWPYWTLFADNVVQIVADGKVYTFS